MRDCVVYVSSVLNPKKHPRKIQCLESFAIGARAQGADVLVEWDYKYTPSRLAVMLGWATTNVGGKNILLRKQIISEQQQRHYHTMCIDASCWKYLDNSGTYLRYSLGGPFYDKAQYANKDSDPSKWLEISQRLGVKLEPNRNNQDGYVLICMQRDGGFAMKSLDPIKWVKEKIQQIRQVSNRPIMVRPHPGAYKMSDFNFCCELDVGVFEPLQTTLIQNLNGAHSAVFFNSSSSVSAVCFGVPIFVDDVSCVSWAVANKDISKIESPELFKREQWVYDLAAAHWSDTDGQSGRIYKKFLPYLT